MDSYIDRKDLYQNGDPQNEPRTRKRLIQISKIGMTEVMRAEFGIEGLMSGLYIEYAWRYSDKEWDGYIDWVKGLIRDKKIK